MNHHYLLTVIAAVATLAAALTATQVPFQMDALTCEANIRGCEYRSVTTPVDQVPKEYCPCDNYGEIDPLLHRFHKVLYEKCDRFCKLRDRLGTSIPIF